MLSTQGLVGLLKVLAGADAFNSMLVKLAKAPITVTPAIVPADFSEADFTGYAAGDGNIAGIAWDDEFGNGVLSLDGIHFQPTGTAIGNTIYGVYVTQTLSGVLCVIAWQAIDPPVVLASPSDALDVMVKIKIGQPLPLGV